MNSEISAKYNQKNTIMRLFLYLFLSFLPFIIIIPILNQYIGEKLFVSKRADIIYTVGMLGMLVPSVIVAQLSRQKSLIFIMN